MMDPTFRSVTAEPDAPNGELDASITEMFELHERELAGATAGLEMATSDVEILSHDSP